MSTAFVKESDVKRRWLLIDAEGLVLGRMASIIANILRGKDKPFFTPHVDCGDNVVVVNAEKILLTGKKLTDKKFYWHTGYPGGIKERTMKQLLNSPLQDRVIRNAVKRMISKGPLREQILKKLKVYKGVSHPHAAQQPEIFNIATMNAKNVRRV
ncbi:50S ribosomal protein L13 [Alphaproteobacteria bacterium]|nr:50S ribosomal protein L13 [Alphaproteobacteria bacterium]